MSVRYVGNVIADYAPKPYRLVAFGNMTRTTGKGKHTRTKVISFGVVAWNSDEIARTMYDPGRLHGAGTFCWPGLHAVRREAMRLLAGEYTQVQVRTNQDRVLYIWNKHSDGRISGYNPQED